MRETFEAYRVPFILFSLFILLIPPTAAADPVTTFIIEADSIARTGGDEALARYVAARAVIVGAAVGQLIDVAVQVGDGGNTSDEQENFEFAARVARLYEEKTGRAAPLQLVETYRSWTPQQRATRARARALEDDAAAARGAGELDRALELYNEAKTLYGQIGDARSVAVTWGSLGVTYWYAGDMDAVAEQYREALAARRAIDDRILEGRTLNGLGSVNFQTSNYTAALDFYAQAADLRRRTGDLGGLGTSLTYAGHCYSRMGRLTEARDSYEDALVVLKQTGGGPKMIGVLNGIAGVYSEMGRGRGANDALERAIAISREIGDTQQEIDCRINLAINYKGEERFREALEQLAVAEELLAATSEPIKTALLHNTRGQTYLGMGEFERAKKDLLRYRELSPSLDDPYFQIEALVRLGALYKEVGAYDEGLATAEEAIALARESGSGQLVHMAVELAANLEFRRGDYEAALARWQSLEDVDRASGIEIDILITQLSIGNMLASLGRMDEARARYDAIRARVAATGLVRLRSMLHLGIAHTYETENPDSAVYHYEYALDLIEQSRSAVGGAATTTGYLSGQRRRFYEEVARFYASLEADGGSGAWSARAFHTIERAKARGLLDLLDASVASAHAADADALLDAYYALDPKAPDYESERRRLEQQYNALRESRLEDSFGEMTTGGVVAGLEAVQKALPKKTVLLEYALGDTASLLWVIDRKNSELHELPARSQLRAQVERLRGALKRPGAGDKVLRQMAYDLYVTLVRPAETRLAKAKKLVIVPDGVLFELPFEVLLTEPAGDDEPWHELSFLARSFAPVYEPSATIYIRQATQKKKAKYYRELLALGDPDFTTLGATDLAPLPNSRTEVINISARVKDDKKAVYLGREASEARLKADVRKGSSRIVHLATHGLVDDVEPNASSVVLCADDASGEDGYLHTLEILSLSVDAGAVVVSACESARGRVGRGEGVVGLSRAFIAAGARSIVASLWRVSDESTAELMNHFYERMLDKKRPAGEALNDARLALVENPKYAHPFYWSPFIVIGTDRSPW